MTAHQLKAWRERLGFNKAEAARALGMTADAYGRMEARGETDRRTDLACAAIAYGLPPMGAGPIS